LQRTGAGFGALALAAMLSDDVLLSARANGRRDEFRSSVPRSGNFAPRAKSVIWLFMDGGQSHIDIGIQAQLAKHDGQQLEASTRTQGFFTDQVGR